MFDWLRKTPQPIETPVEEVKSSYSQFWSNINTTISTTQSSTLAACLSYGQRAIADVELVAEKYDGKTWVDQLLPSQITKDASKSGLDFQGRLQATYSDSFRGNSLWIKLRNGRRQLVGYQYIPWQNVNVTKSTDGNSVLAYNVVGGGSFAPQDVVHFRFGSDPQDFLLGLDKYAVLESLLNADYLIQTYQESLVLAPAPGHILTAKSGTKLTQPIVDKITQQYKELTSGRNAGGVMVVSAAEFDINSVKFSPAELDMAKIADYVEERICAVLGIPQQVVGLGENKSTYSNMEAAQRQAATNNVIPFLQTIAKTLTEQSPELFYDQNRLRFKTEDMSAMQIDLNSESKRIAELYRVGAINRGQAQSALGYDPTPEMYNEWASNVPINTERQNNGN